MVSGKQSPNTKGREEECEEEGNSYDQPACVCFSFVCDFLFRVRCLFLSGMGISMLGTFLIHQFLYRQYWMSLFVRWMDCLAINIQLATGLLGYGQSWKMWPVNTLSVTLACLSCILLTLETRLRWITPPSNNGVKCGSER